MEWIVISLIVLLTILTVKSHLNDQNKSKTANNKASESKNDLDITLNGRVFSLNFSNASSGYDKQQALNSIQNLLSEFNEIKNIKNYKDAVQKAKEIKKEYWKTGDLLDSKSRSNFLSMIDFLFKALIPPVEDVKKNNADEINAIIYGLPHGASICFVDFETNGFLATDSVLNCAIIKTDRDLNVIDTIDRYYFPDGDLNKEAAAVNGLTIEKIKFERRGADYSEYYTKDDEIMNFFENVKLIVAHNFDFDKKFVPKKLKPKISKKDIASFCTMESNINVIRASWIVKKNEYKYPSLEETAKYYSIPFDKFSAHSGMYDAQTCLGIFKAMKAGG